MINDNNLNSEERVVLLGMEFIKQKDGKYLIVNSNGKVVDEKEKLELENNELVFKDIECKTCVKDITKKISKNKKRIKELDNEDIEEAEPIKE